MSREEVPEPSIPARGGFSVQEIATVPFIIGILVVLIIGMAEKGQQAARATACLSNVRQIQTAMVSYATDYDGDMPPEKQHYHLLMPYTGMKEIFRCPSVPEKPRATESARARQGEKGKETIGDYIMNPFAQTDDLPATMVVGDDAPARHLGRRWAGARLDGATALWPAREWQQKIGWVIENDKQSTTK